MSRTGDKKKEEKYCQENFDFNFDFDIKKNFTMFLIILCVLLLGIAVLYGLLRYNKNQEILENVKQFISNHGETFNNCTENGLNMNLHINKKDDIALPCTCYYYNNVITGCTDQTKKFIYNDKFK
jgi:hypothetical protein